MDLINLLVYIVILSLVFYLIYWILEKIPLVEPFKTVILVVVGLIAVIILLSLLMGWVPAGRFKL